MLPRKEQSRAENYTPRRSRPRGHPGRERSAKGPQVVLSRTDPALLIKLFEQEVPEIYDGTVVIRGAVREAGDRAKVAVFSRERDVDPVGACVGMKGTRVQSIIRELRGEKIDIVEWSDDPIAFVTNAISPAKVQRVSIVDDGERVMEVVVEDKQLSLAIGKKGQNVRLAAKLTGWRSTSRARKRSATRSRRSLARSRSATRRATARRGATETPSGEGETAETAADGADGGAAADGRRRRRPEDGRGAAVDVARGRGGTDARRAGSADGEPAGRRADARAETRKSRGRSGADRRPDKSTTRTTTH